MNGKSEVQPSNNSSAGTRPQNFTPSSAEPTIHTIHTIVPQFALDAADARIASWSAAIVEAAEAIERLIGSESLPEAVRDLAASTAQKLRALGTRSGEKSAADLVVRLQHEAAAHPAASIGAGAAIGAALATLLVRFGKPASANSV